MSSNNAHYDKLLTYLRTAGEGLIRSQCEIPEVLEYTDVKTLLAIKNRLRYGTPLSGLGSSIPEHIVALLVNNADEFRNQKK